jgi:hypothetical protein
MISLSIYSSIYLFYGSKAGADEQWRNYPTRSAKKLCRFYFYFVVAVGYYRIPTLGTLGNELF